MNLNSKQNTNKIRMRTIKNTSKNLTCDICNSDINNVLNLFEIAFNNNLYVTICDRCNNQLLMKTLKADILVSSRTKDKHDIAIIDKRNRLRNIKRDAT